MSEEGAGKTQGPQEKTDDVPVKESRNPDSLNSGKSSNIDAESQSLQTHGLVEQQANDSKNANKEEKKIKLDETIDVPNYQQEPKPPSIEIHDTTDHENVNDIQGPKEFITIISPVSMKERQGSPSFSNRDQGTAGNQSVRDFYRSDLSFYKFKESAEIIAEKEELCNEEPNISGFHAFRTFRGKVGKRHLIYTILLLSIVLLICALIPITVILSNGTKGSVIKFFRRSSQDQREELLSELSGRYLQPSNDEAPIDPEGAFLNGFNSHQGINPKYLNDPEVVSLMKSSEEFGTTFYGLAYTPKNSMEPKCGVTQRDVLLDVAKLSTVTTRIRTYGVQCNQTELILNAFQELDLNMTLAMGVWIGSDEKVNQNQIATMKQLLQKYPRKYIESIFIGNEVLFREELSVEKLSSIIIETKAFLKEIGYHDIPVGTTEIGSLITKELTKNCDIIGANIHPFFGGGIVEKATKWSFEYIEEEVKPNVSNAKIYITEIGWPSGGGRHKGAVAGKVSFKTFLNSFICEAYANDYAWFYFEAFDGPWKKVFYEGNNKWETQWGVFTSDRELKIEALPNC